MLGAGDEYVNTPGGGGGVQCHPILNPPQKDEGEKKFTLMGSKEGFGEGLKNLSLECLHV